MSETPDNLPSTLIDKNYRAFLLRMWRSSDENWRVILENIHTGEQTSFTSLGKLMLFLQQRQEEDVV